MQDLVHLQLMDSKAAELERLLSQLSDVNDGMRNALGGRNDTRAHTLTRHRDILHDYQQVCAYSNAQLHSCILQIILKYGNLSFPLISCLSFMYVWKCIVAGVSAT